MARVAVLGWCIAFVQCWFWPRWDTCCQSLCWNVFKNPFWQRNSANLKRADTRRNALVQVLVVNSSFALELCLWYWVSLQWSGSCRRNEKMNWTLGVPLRDVLCLPCHHIPPRCSHPAVRSLFDLWQLFIYVSVSNKVCFALLPCCASTQTGNCAEKNWTSLMVDALGICKQACEELFNYTWFHVTSISSGKLSGTSAALQNWLYRQNKMCCSVEAGVPLPGSNWGHSSREECWTQVHLAHPGFLILITLWCMCSQVHNFNL